MSDLEQRVDDLEERLNRHSDAIYGNGVDGLKTRVAVLEANSRSKRGLLSTLVSIGLAAFSGLIAIIAAVMAMK